jgi:ferredoxin
MSALAEGGRQIIGPTRRDGAVVYEPIDQIDDLPRGWVDDQGGGSYRLRREGDRFFGYAVGPSSWKRYLHPPRQRLFTVRSGEVLPEPLAQERYAFIGMRGCEIAAMEIQDKVFMEGPFGDPHYAARREGLFIVAVNCTRAAATCFCASMETGPAVQAGHDIALTETDEGMLAEAGSDAGAALLGGLGLPEAPPALTEAKARAVAPAMQQERRIDTQGLPELLMQCPDHPRWSELAERCLGCANCTMVCPTCFCTSTEEISMPGSEESARENRWGSCFTHEFSYVHGGEVRPSAKARYRQWMTHKLATWHDQFGSSGCTGCGRCITWCPVGIDLTEEAAAIRREGV